MEEEFSARVQCYPRDFLKRFGSGGGEVHTESESRERSDLELSLGLSLGGGYETKQRCFVRSPTIGMLTSMFQLGDDFSASGPLARACSLPRDALAQKKKRKELPSRKKSDGQRKRSENMRFKPGATDAKYDILDDELEDGQCTAVGEQVNGVVTSLSPTPTMMARSQMADRLICFAPEIQVSFGSQSNILKQGLNMPGSKSHAEVKSVSTTTLMFPEQRRNYMGTTKAAASMNTKAAASDDDGSYWATVCADGILKNEVERKVMQEMPCVSTKGCGPNGTRIQGFLYKYRKGEDVRIVCVCHGKFFSPAEFVKHAGGGEVNQPLRHIVVSPSPGAFL